ncbi:hypothetical protein DKX38_011729 [Salix brachista]|uniref:Uncharacterized protein n=1 Tax=Salix brachista TaxID=2182728 RepID=A0A5N5M294_9ROSI|nr:hypothetical protein DKX38_011729 [Salix brachista]
MVYFPGGGGERNGIEGVVVGIGIVGIVGRLGRGGKVSLGRLGIVGRLGSGGSEGCVVGCGGNGGIAGLGKFGREENRTDTLNFVIVRVGSTSHASSIDYNFIRGSVVPWKLLFTILSLSISVCFPGNWSVQDLKTQS